MPIPMVIRWSTDTLVRSLIPALLCWCFTVACERTLGGADDRASSPPAAPSELVVAAVSGNRIQGSFVDNSNDEESFRIDRGVGASFQIYMTLAANTTSFTDTSVAPRRTYSYRVLAANGAGASEYSNTASATTTGATSEHPNEPAGFTRIFETAFTDSEIPVYQGGNACEPYEGVLPGTCVWRYDRGTPVQTLIAPGVPPRGKYALRITFPAGLTAGDSPSWWNIWDDSQAGADDKGQDYDEYYEHGWVYWDGGTDGQWEFAGITAGVKFLGQMGVGLSNAGGRSPQNLHPPGGGRSGSGTRVFVSSFSLNEFSTDPECSGGSFVPFNEGAAIVTIGQWHEYEFIVRVNSPGAADGEAHFWWNGVKTLDRRGNVRWRDKDCTAGFWVRRWDTAYGGGDLATEKETDDYFWINYVYASGKN